MATLVVELRIKGWSCGLLELFGAEDMWLSALGQIRGGEGAVCLQ